MQGCDPKLLGTAGEKEMMRRLLVAIGCLALALGITGGYSPSSTRAIGGADQPTALEGDSQLYEFEERAKAAGALGFYWDELTSSLVTLVPAAKSAVFDLARLGPLPGSVAVKISDVALGAIDRANDKLEKVAGELAAGDSMGFFFNPRLQKIEVTASLGAGELAGLLGDSWGLIEYRPGGISPAGRFNDVSPFWG